VRRDLHRDTREGLLLLTDMRELEGGREGGVRHSNWSENIHAPVGEIKGEQDSSRNHIIQIGEWDKG
jgi:hypothetical protein